MGTVPAAAGLDRRKRYQIATATRIQSHKDFVMVSFRAGIYLDDVAWLGPKVSQATINVWVTRWLGFSSLGHPRVLRWTRGACLDLSVGIVVYVTGHLTLHPGSRQ